MPWSGSFTKKYHVKSIKPCCECYEERRRVCRKRFTETVREERTGCMEKKRWEDSHGWEGGRVNERNKASPLRSHTLPWQLWDFNESKEVTIDVIINICWTVFLSFFLKVVIVKAQLEDTMQTFFIWCNLIVQICWIWKLKYQLRHSTQDHLKLSFIFIYICSPIKQTTKHKNTHTIHTLL